MATRKMKKLLSFTICICMVIGMLTMGVNAEWVLNCELGDHEHGAECYSTEHSDDCYTTNPGRNHQHNDGCVYTPHEHSAENGCRAHEHSSRGGCYHEHHNSCYTTNCDNYWHSYFGHQSSCLNLVCEIEEGALECTKEWSCTKTGSYLCLRSNCLQRHTLICDKHQHDDSCYTWQQDQGGESGGNFEWVKVVVQGQEAHYSRGTDNDAHWMASGTYSWDVSVEGTTLYWRAGHQSGSVDLTRYVTIPEGYKVDSYSASSVSVDGVNSQSAMIDNATITVTIDTLMSPTGEVVEFFTLTVNHVDEEGNALVTAEVTNDIVEGTDYSTSAKLFDEWAYKGLAEGSDPASGTMDSNKTVTYVYSKEIVPPPVPTYDISYAVTGTERPATASDIPTGETGVEVGTTGKSVAAGLTTTETSKDGVEGTWTFSGWTTADADVSNGSFTMPDNDVLFTGSWSFSATPKYDITYVVTGDQPANPSADYSTLGESGIKAGTPKSVAAALTTTDTTKGDEIGTWSFSGWSTTTGGVPSSGSFDMPASNVTFTGSWTFTATPKHDITYTVEGDAPATSTPALSTLNETDVLTGTPKSVAGGLETTETAKNGAVGTWIFNGWVSQTEGIPSVGSFDMPNSDVAFVGSWTFTATPTYNITYTVNGDAPATASADSAALGETGILAGDGKTVAAGLTTTETSKDGKAGVWTFSGWTTADAAVANGSFEMPAKHVNFVGTWTFTAKSNISYTVEGAAPATASADPAALGETGVLAGAAKTVAEYLSTEETTDANGAVGTWIFNGWVSQTEGVPNVGEYAMPANDVAFVGSWTFTASPLYSITYTVNGTAPATASADPAALGETGILEGTAKTVAARLTTNETTNVYGEEGVWTFSGWRAQTAGVPNSGSFNMPGMNVVFVGTWSFEADELPPPPTPTPDPEPTPTPVVIEDEDPPLVEEPPVEIEEEPVPLAEIPEEPVPLSDVPVTGDMSAVSIAMFLLSGLALIALLVIRKRERDEA